MSSWHSYPSIFNLGHAAVRPLNDVEIYLEEKVDGSQFSFGVFDGEVRCRSKGQQLNVDAPEGMFAKAVASVLERKGSLRDGWTYRGEYLSKPKHNALAYERVPVGHIIIFDINTGEEGYLPRGLKGGEACRIGLEAVPVLYEGALDQSKILELLQTDSVLGGQKIEGVVVKQQDVTLYGPDKKALIAKYVSEAFKEVHAANWKIANPKQGDILQVLGAGLSTEARWRKSVQHLRDAGQLEDTPRDIGKLIKEVPDDIIRDAEDQIRTALWDWAWPHLKRMSTAGLAEWYKKQLLEQQFEVLDAVKAIEESGCEPTNLGREIDAELDVTGSRGGVL